MGRTDDILQRTEPSLVVWISKYSAYRGVGESWLRRMEQISLGPCIIQVTKCELMKDLDF